MITDLVNNRRALAWATAITYGVLISRVANIYSWEWWALLVLWVMIEHMSYSLGFENGVCTGVTLPERQRNQLKKVIEDDEKKRDSE